MIDLPSPKTNHIEDVTHEKANRSDIYGRGIAERDCACRPNLIAGGSNLSSI
ncbi:hypothetical protein [Candidatus Accumulibacter vicinus]|uniref:hypothetical protein n=1 Tax=Candidatus Accumulibacter vicinus TaxID=2954382 RepID=UPI00235B6B28|nr:hypothetical protein [Candidatus Accumulibacter vicinus]